MLQDSSVIGEPIQVIQFQFRQLIRRLLGNSGGELNSRTLHAVAPNPCKTFDVTLCYFFPDQLPREQISAFTHGMAYSRRVQKLDCLLCDSTGILEGNQRAAMVV